MRALLAELARDAERAGWDGFFLWDHIARPGAPAGRRPVDRARGDRGRDRAHPLRRDGDSARAAPALEGRARDGLARSPLERPTRLRRGARQLGRRERGVGGARRGDGPSAPRASARRGTRDPVRPVERRAVRLRGSRARRARRALPARAGAVCRASPSGSRATGRTARRCAARRAGTGCSRCSATARRTTRRSSLEPWSSCASRARATRRSTSCTARIATCPSSPTRARARPGGSRA